MTAPCGRPSPSARCRSGCSPAPSRCRATVLELNRLNPPSPRASASRSGIDAERSRHRAGGASVREHDRVATPGGHSTRRDASPPTPAAQQAASLSSSASPAAGSMGSCWAPSSCVRVTPNRHALCRFPCSRHRTGIASFNPLHALADLAYPPSSTSARNDHLGANEPAPSEWISPAVQPIRGGSRRALHPDRP